MMYNYYVDGQGFDTYEEAAFYADVLLAQFNVYRCVYTKDEINSKIGALA